MGSAFNQAYRRIALRRLASKSVRAAGYDPLGFVLRVQYRNGEDVVYKGVPVHLYSGLLSAGSKSTYCRDYLEGHYPREVIAVSANRWWQFSLRRPKARHAAVAECLDPPAQGPVDN